jgi:outer membrane protein TolC
VQAIDKRIGYLGASALFLVLSGCAVDRYDARPIFIDAISDNLAARSLTAGDVRECTAKQWPPATWNLNSLTTAAFCLNTDIEAARRKLDTTVAAVTTAAQRPNPVLQVPLQKTLNPADGQSPWTLGLALDFSVEIAGKHDLRMAAANVNVTAARLNVASVAWGVRSQLRSLLLVLWFSSERARLLQKQLEFDERLERLLERRVAIGYTSALELNQQRHALAQATKNAAAALRDAVEVKVKIASLVGARTSAFESIGFDVAGFSTRPSPVPDEGIRLNALRNRADILSGLVEYEASQAALQLEVAKQYPDLHLGPGYTLDQGARKIGLSFSGLELPIFNQNQGAIAEARARRLEAEAKVKQIVAKVFMETDLATAAYDASRTSLSNAQAQLHLAGRRLAAAHASLSAGEDDQVLFLSAEKSEVESQLTLLDATLQMQQAIGQIEDAMQLPLSEPTLE